MVLLECVCVSSHAGIPVCVCATADLYQVCANIFVCVSARYGFVIGAPRWVFGQLSAGQHTTGHRTPAPQFPSGPQRSQRQEHLPAHWSPHTLPRAQHSH